jgi:ubiquinone/menaquinone biosynthesis C-methylase UbiE
VACGNGRFLKLLSDKYYIHGYGIDISDKMIENAKAYCPTAEFRTGSCEQTGFEDRKFDVITVCAAYHHFPDVRGFAKEAARIIKPQGIIYIAEIYYPFPLRPILNMIFPLSKAGDVKSYTQKEITSNFSTYGFQMIRYRREDHIQIVAMKKL